MRWTIPVTLAVFLVAAAFLLTESIRKETSLPIWSLPLEGTWGDAPDSPTLREGCLDLLRKARDGDTVALDQLDRHLDALKRERGGDHPLTRVEAWRDLLRDVYGQDRLPEPGIHEDTGVTNDPDLAELKGAVLVPGPVSGAVTLIATLPAPGEDPADHLRRWWAGTTENVLVAATEVPNSGPAGRWQFLFPVAFARDRYRIDDDRIFLAGIRGREELAARAAASYADRLAGLVVGPGKVPPFPLRSNLETLPRLRIVDESRALVETAAWIHGGSDGKPLRRTLYPERIDWRAGPRGVENEAWWLWILPRGGEAGARIRAEILGRNRIRIRTEGIREFRIRLNDRLVDLDREVIVEVEGGPEISHTPMRSVECMVDLALTRGDLSAVFTDEIEVEVK